MGVKITTNSFAYRILKFLFIGGLFLQTTSACIANKSDILSESKAVKNIVKAKILTSQPLTIGKKTSAKLKLIFEEDHKPALPSELNLDHTKKIHVLIFDQTLADHQHVHPTPTDEPGVYTFDWTPREESQYKAWISFIPLATGQEEFIVVDLGNLSKNTKKVNKVNNLTQNVDGLQYRLSFEDQPLSRGKPIKGKILITDEKGNPFSELEPLMGAFLHIVAINEDFKSLSHIWPEISGDSERGPEFNFHMELRKPGFWKIWGFVIAKGKEQLIPFGVIVK